jgi:hypothetical protein
MQSSSARPAWGRRRSAWALAGILSISLGVILLPWAAGRVPTARASTVPAGASAPQASHRSAGPHGATVRGPRMWVPNRSGTGGKYLAHRSEVTVSQVNDLEFQSVVVSWKGFAPTTGPAANQSEPYYSNERQEQFYTVVVAQCKGADPKTPKDCWGIYEGGLHGNTNWGGVIPAPASGFNTSYAASGLTGTGEVDMELYTNRQLPLLGCGLGHPCSLVVVADDGGNPGGPGEGKAACQDHSGDYTLGDDWAEDQTANSFDYGSTIDPCSWDDRFVVPLSFGHVQGDCPVPSTYDITAEGSPTLYQAMSSWQSKLCAGSHSISILYDSAITEPQAITDFQDGATDVALTTLPVSGKSGRSYTYAPVAISAESVAFWVDNPNTGKPYTKLKLDARLVLKLITQSYSWGGWGCGVNYVGPPGGCDKKVTNDYASMFDDPEFHQLNRGILTPLSVANGGGDYQFEQPTTIYGLSDLNWELTRWIAANKPAMAFLHGAHQGPEHVNLAYKTMKLPTYSLGPMDKYEQFQLYYGQAETLQSIASEYQVENTSTAHYQAGNCQHPTQFNPCNPAVAAENPGERDLFAILDQGDASAFNLPVAALENAAGKYVTPTAASMTAAVEHDMVTAGNGLTQQVNVAKKVKAAYPLTMVVYAVVPTSGTPKKTATKIAQWLDYVAGAGQKQGLQAGDLPPGYAPLTAKMRAQTRKAAKEVLDQTGSKSDTNPSPSPSSTNGGTNPSSSTSPSGSTSPAPTASPSPAASSPFYLGDVADPASSGIARYALPALLIAGGLLALVGSLTVIAGQGGGTAALAWLRRVVRRRSKG